MYRLLPSAETFEYGGFLTESKIHFVKCKEKSASVISAYPCTFHSHPTNLEGTEPDLPSGKDIYSFLKWRQQRAITVGRELIWVFDKTVETVPIIKSLETWERGNMISTFGKLRHDKVEDEANAYIPIVLNAPWDLTGLSGLLTLQKTSTPAGRSCSRRFSSSMCLVTGGDGFEQGMRQ